MDIVSKDNVKVKFIVKDYTIKSNSQLANKVFEMKLEGDTSCIKKAGQFINIEIKGFFLRRPISIADYDNSTITIVYRVVGEGTEKMSLMKENDKLNCIVALGNGFEIDNISNKNILLVGGGIGVPPMFKLAKELKNNNNSVTMVMGFNSKEEVFYEKQFKQVVDKLVVTTVDGSYGIKGFVTDGVDVNSYDTYMACGPEPMLKALLRYNVIGQLSYEARMGCGFGACMGCTCKTNNAYKRICVDGPVLSSEELK